MFISLVRSLFLLVFLALCGTALGQTTVTMQEGLNGYAGTTDTAADIDHPTAGFHSHEQIFIGYDNTRFMNLVRFKIFAAEGGPVPDGATIISATLSLNRTAGSAKEVEARRMVRDWNELQATWQVASTGVSWQLAGANGANDVANAGDGTTSVGAAAGWFDVDVTESVQAFAGGTPNRGWRLNHVSGGNSIMSFQSRNSTQATLRPKLTVTYTTTPTGNTATLREGLNGYVGTTDTAGNSSQPGAGYHSHAELFVGYDDDGFMTLVRFKIFASEGGPIPDGTSITSATLSLNKTGGLDAVLEAHRMLRDWNELQATWTVASTGTPWQTPGANGANDVSPSGDGTTSVPATNGWFSLDVTESVQAFSANPSANYGWRINHVSGPNSIKNFTSRNSTSAELRPTLTIVYGPVGPTAPTASYTWSQVPGTLNVTFNANGSQENGASITGLRLRFGHGTPEAEANWSDKTLPQTHAYPAPGTYTAKLTATNSAGTSAEFSQPITVTDPGSGGGGDIAPDQSDPAGALGASVPTFHNMSLYFNPGSAPSGCPATPSACKVWMRYRKASEPNSAWHEGYPMWYDARATGNGLPYAYKARGSAVHLQPGTKYYFEFGLGASYASADWTHHVAGTTWSETFTQDGPTIPIPSQSGPLVIAPGQGGTNGYKVYDGWNGSSRNVIDRAGAGQADGPEWDSIDEPHLGAGAGRFQDTSFAIVVKDSFVIIRNVVAKGAAAAGILIYPGVTDVIIENVEVSDWSWRKGKTWTGTCGNSSCEEPTNPNTWGTWGMNEAGGIHLSGNNSRIVVQKTVIKDPHYGAFPWDTHADAACSGNPKDHPVGPTGITVYHGGQQNVFRYNEISGHPTDATRWLMDGFSGANNFGLQGAPGADSDIYQNILMRIYDDGIEAEGGGRNVRIWGNYLNDIKVAVGTTTVHYGPTYVWRNVVNRIRTCYRVAEDQDWASTAFKYGGFDNGYGDGIRYLFHNTLLQEPGGAFPNGAGVGVEGIFNGSGSVRYTIARNNILHVRKPAWRAVDGYNAPDGSDFGYNVYNGTYSGITESTPAATYKFTDGQLFYKPGHGHASVPALGGGGTGNYQLDSGSKGLDVGEGLPTFNAGFGGSAPDAGAHENGAPPMTFGISAGQ